ncbi:GNAT family N-acetyltransferase [Aliikangiella maris]|uniref:GNAT family N-acetyltransferase n=2 Tax=Aliikangiella maris TaxID=3162458 RepID=A0ABV2BTV8_9GAMM
MQIVAYSQLISSEQNKTSLGQLESAKANDVNQNIMNLILDIQQNEFGLPITANEQKDLSEIDDFYIKEGGNFWVAIVDGGIVGTIALIYLGTTEKFLAAHQFYRKHGYAEINRELLPQGFPIMQVDKLFFMKKL